jgi:putative sigma-54 modulation protein
MNQKSKMLDTFPQYDISVQGRHVQVTDAMKDYVIEKLSKLDRFSTRIIDIAVTMDIQKLEHRVDVVMKFDHMKIKVQSSSDNMYASIDKAVDKLQARIRKYKERIQDHQAKGRAIVEMKVNILNAERDLEEETEQERARYTEKVYESHEIVRTETRPMKILTQDEALMKMELSNDQFLIYRSEEDRRIKVIYRMKDSNYGVIDVE